MRRKAIKRISITIFVTMLLTTVNCFATTMINEEIINKEETEYIKRSYTVPVQEEKDFLLNLEKQINKEKKTFELQETNRNGGDTVETIDIITSKTVITDSNKSEDILNQLPQEIDYEENNFVGKYILDTNSIDVKSKYNGYKEVLVEETKIYTNLDTNDLDNIPKQVIKDGLVLDLITTNWEISETRNLQDNIIPSKYNATCYYATKKKVDNPLSYIVKAEYRGTAERIIENDYIYEITYKCIKEDKNIIPIITALSGTTFVIIVIIFLRKKKEKNNN